MQPLNFKDIDKQFQNIVDDVIEAGQLLFDGHRSAMSPRCNKRKLEIQIVDNENINACAIGEGETDKILIFRGSIEHIYGTMLGLMSCPEFLPTVGVSSAESLPDCSKYASGFAPLPILRKRLTEEVEAKIRFPKDQTRFDVAWRLASMALEFLVFHEVGHLLGGHYELLTDSNLRASLSEFQPDVQSVPMFEIYQALECDADVFAACAASFINTRTQHRELTENLIGGPNRLPNTNLEWGLYSVSIGVLFRMLFPNGPARVVDDQNRHPHPAVRSMISSCTALGRVLNRTPEELAALENAIGFAIRNVENAWANIFYTSQVIDPWEAWAQSIFDQTAVVLNRYKNLRPQLEKFARVPRRWHDWE